MKLSNIENEHEERIGFEAILIQISKHSTLFTKEIMLHVLVFYIQSESRNLVLFGIFRYYKGLAIPVYKVLSIYNTPVKCYTVNSAAYIDIFSNKKDFLYGLLR
ncbi:hypothetical protein BGI33_12665 [Snodgrassella alvi]|uniref:Uncharacterized protein n=1 Tax=Snodgrassella alvi TaxID=1196083 RepID=A0A2N9WU40_9NEIS|nr:hypothetical protein BGI33_12665 [Snodgrassella alvi]PIT15503.1 hypothetical protein BGI34_12850 [Snodgrassella alvi]PIT15521.1 hypothetical protein BGI32_05525 [Snodgrassella alvi]